MKVFRKVLYFILGILLLMLIYQIYVYCVVRERYEELNNFKQEYDKLTEEIAFYNDFKNSYEFVIKEKGELDAGKALLVDKVNVLNNDIDDLKSKIESLNDKIKNLS